VFADMSYWGPDGYIELTGLIPGQWYDLRIYQRAWGYQITDRSFRAVYDVGSNGSVEFTTLEIDQNDPTLTPPGLSGDVSWALSYVYLADASGKIKVTIDQVHNRNFHLYGLTNQKFVDW